MSSALSDLSAIPVARRRRLAGLLGLFAVLLVAVGAVAATGADSALLVVFVAIAFVAALLLALLAWGVLTSVRNELAEQAHQAALDAVLAEALAAAAGTPAVREFTAHDCGHDHDPDEMHVTGDACEHDGGGGVGGECSRSCDTCVFARLRPGSTDAQVAARPQA